MTAPGDLGGTQDLVISETGTEDYMLQIEQNLFQRFKEGRRNFHVCGKHFWLSRIPALCRGHATPSVVGQLCQAGGNSIVVAHVLMRQACLFLPGSTPKAICLTCALRLSTHRMVLLLVVRGDEVFQAVHRGRGCRPIPLSKALLESLGNH